VSGAGRLGRLIVATLALGGLLLSVPAAGSAQAPSANPEPCRPSAASPCAAVADGSELTISLMTMGVGAEVWERFGHNAILVEDHLHGTARAYNYGLFDFRQENFLLRFVQGRMWYWMQGFDAAPMVQSYVRANRSVWVQLLNLAPEQRRALADFLAWNERPENRFYRYDYYRDNCSTRVRDALDRVLGGRIRAETDTIATGTTYRWHTERLAASDVPLYTGLQLALGEPADRPLSAWEEMFLPLRLRDWMRRVTVTAADGRQVPLVIGERALYESTGPAPRSTPPHWVLGYLVAGLAVGALLAGLGRRSPRSKRAGRGFAWLAGGWSLVLGLAGGILAGLWAFTDHAAAYRNENLFQANLLLLPLAVLAPRLVRGAAWARRPAVALGAAVAAASVAGLLLKALPGFDQGNAEVLALAVPANLGIGIGLWWAARGGGAAKA
jgi:hypothetical protein